jgi:hypothetical protein
MNEYNMSILDILSLYVLGFFCALGIWDTILKVWAYIEQQRKK